jgi:NhaA family Na+:H+ antiporter
VLKSLKNKIRAYSYYRNNIFKDFLESEKSSGYILLLLTVLSLVLANGIIGNKYLEMWRYYVDLSFFNVQLKYSVEHWINDGLMAIFFLLVGLEISREIYAGELSTIKKASLPAFAALGGMLVPALIHYIFNSGTIYQRGYGIPMATDIAFTLGVLSLLGNRIPLAVKVFITALAIIDDLGAIIIIAVFYTSSISFSFLLASLGIFAFMFLMNKAKINILSPYMVLGVIMWYCMLKSGVHSTIAGVLLAFAIPFRKKGDINPAHKLQKILHKPVAFIILPVFALANTAIKIPNDIVSGLNSTNAIGIFLGLFIGKPVGITLFSLIAVKLGLSSFSREISLKLLFGVASLAGIGFTMSIFITNLAFSDQIILDVSKLSIIIASFLSAVTGLLILKMAVKE